MEPLDLPYFNNTNFPLAVKNQLGKLKFTDEEAKKLRYNQFIPKEFFSRSTYARGLLLAHAMGHGKTRLAVAISQHFINTDPKRRIIVLMPSSLKNNFKKNIDDYNSNSSEKSISSNKYKFVSLNAGNMFKQVSNVDKTEEEMKYEQKLGKFMDDIIRKNSLENSLLIIDEAHNLFNAITNGSKNATALYDLIMSARNLKLIFLTGTPIINTPFELVPCFNMLRGKMQTTGGGPKNCVCGIGGIRGTDGCTCDSNTETYSDTGVYGGFGKAKKPSKFVTLFTESYGDFIDYFIDEKKHTIKNKDKFANRIYGLTSYYGDLYFSKTKNKPGFPTKLETIVDRVPMSPKQYSVYIVARGSELEETSKGYKGKNTRFSASQGGSSTYRVKSRQISNYAIPSYALGPVRGMKSRKKFIDRIKSEDLKNTKEFSPKMGKIMENIKKHEDQLGLVYSQFVSGEGLGIFSKILEVEGYTNLLDSKHAINMDINVKTTMRYAILSGAISTDLRAEIITMFNSKDNANGELIQILLLSGAVAEGIDLKRVRHVHIMDPYWNYARINQVETRAIRLNSHEDLPKNQQNVQVYIYLSDYPKNTDMKNIKEKTTDVELYEKSINNMKLINSFLLVLAETSIDCSMHVNSLPEEIKKGIQCKICSPNDKPLFHPLVDKDMTLPNNCIPYAETKVDVKGITIDGTDDKFYYKIVGDMPTIYMYNKKIQGYTEMPRSYPYYGAIMEKLLKQ